MPTSVRHSVAAFWSASLLGFAAWGWLAAQLAAEALGDGPAGESAETALALGLAAALVLGAPAAALFGAVMRRVREGAAWRPALATGAALTMAVALPLRAAATALPGDPGLAGAPVLLVAAPAAAMMAGAIAGAISLRRAKVGALLALSARRDGHGPAAKARCG